MKATFSSSHAEARPNAEPTPRRWYRLSPPGGWPWFEDGRHPAQARPRQTAPVFALARPRRLKQSARAVLFWSLGFYVLATLGLDILLDRWCPAPYEKVYRIKWAEFCRLAADGADRPLVVMLGSSRTDGGFQAGQLDGQAGSDGRPILAYNFGVPAAGPIHECLYLREMLERGIRPRLLLVEYLPPLFNDAHSRLISEENWTFSEWVSASHLVRVSPYFYRPFRKRREWVQARLGPWHFYRGWLNGWAQEQMAPPGTVPTIPWYHDRWGCRFPEKLTPLDYARRSAIAGEYIPTLARFRLGEGPARAMHDLLDCCRREQVPTVLIRMPESTTFRSWYSPACRAETDGLLEELRAAYGVGVIDATCWLNDADFVDGHHLDADGAVKFSSRLIDEVRHILP